LSHRRPGDFSNGPVAACFRFLFQSSKKFPGREVWVAAQPFALAFCMGSTGSAAIRSIDSRYSDYALRLEGHPDNAAPATFGGFTVVVGSAPRADGWRSAASLRFSALKFRRSCISFYWFRSLKFELR
jgi:hypothetical protein